MKSILLIIPYFGKWPIWFDAFLISLKHNPTINFLIISDCKRPFDLPDNIKFIKEDLLKFNKKVNDVVEVNIPLSPRKICDIRVAFGDVFRKEIYNYDFWGYCDVDVIWGDIRKFITDEILSNNEIISSRKDNTSGHFTIFKNIEMINSFYKTIPNYIKLFEKEKLQRMDEDVLTAHLKKVNKNTNNTAIRIKWDKILCNQINGRDSHQEYYLDKWQWNNGKMIDVISNTEVMYLHFINWKRTMKYCEVQYKVNPKQFYISFNAMHYNLNSSTAHFVNNLKNIYNGYWVREKRRYRKLKFKSFVKRLKRKLNIKF